MNVINLSYELYEAAHSSTGVKSKRQK